MVNPQITVLLTALMPLSIFTHLIRMKEKILLTFLLEHFLSAQGLALPVNIINLAGQVPQNRI